MASRSWRSGINIDDKIPASVRDGLARDGLAPTEEEPRDLRAEEASGAAQVIAFDRVPADRGGGAEVTYWKDVPAVTKDYEAGRAAFMRHIEAAADALTPKWCKAQPISMGTGTPAMLYFPPSGETGEYIKIEAGEYIKIEAGLPACVLLPRSACRKQPSTNSVRAVCLHTRSDV